MYSITVSPVSTAAHGVVSESRGLSLRFPRFIRTRGDKPISDASTAEFLVSMWKQQQDAGKPAAGPAADDGELEDADISGETEVDLDSDDGDPRDEPVPAPPLL
jgi:DNA ligase-1